jgi:hypothetical protein
VLLKWIKREFQTEYDVILYISKKGRVEWMRSGSRSLKVLVPLRYHPDYVKPVCKSHAKRSARKPYVSKGNVHKPPHAKGSARKPHTKGSDRKHKGGVRKEYTRRVTTSEFDMLEFKELLAYHQWHKICQGATSEELKGIEIEDFKEGGRLLNWRENYA